MTRKLDPQRSLFNYIKVTVEKFLIFITSHNTTIIEVLIAVVLLTALFLGIRWFLLAKDPEPAGGANLAELEESLKKIIAQAGNVPGAGVVAAAGGNEETQKLSTEIAKLKSDLEKKQKEIESISANAAAAISSGGPAVAGLSGDEKIKLETQVKDLEAKLSEYEIISEDIADLSYYKEQNADLQKQLQALKAGGGAAPAATASPPSVPAPSGPEPTIVGKSKVAEANATNTELVAAPEPAAAAAAPAPEPAAAAAAPAPEPAAAAAAPPPAENLVDESLLAGFDEAIKSQDPTGEFDLGRMDVDKMLNEAAEIKLPGDDVDIEKELSGTVDEDKLLKEAVTLDTVTPEDKRLMGQFENFVKKGE